MNPEFMMEMYNLVDRIPAFLYHGNDKLVRSVDKAAIVLEVPKSLEVNADFDWNGRVIGWDTMHDLPDNPDLNLKILDCINPIYDFKVAFYPKDKEPTGNWDIVDLTRADLIVRILKVEGTIVECVTTRNRNGTSVIRFKVDLAKDMNEM